MRAKKCGSKSYVIRPIQFSGNNIILGERVSIGALGRLESITSNIEPLLVIEDDVSIEQLVHVVFMGNLTIGSGSMISSSVYIGDVDHNLTPGKAPKFMDLTHSTTRIGKRCFIGKGATILPGAVLGDDVYVGANSVVRPGVYCSGVYVGCPVRKIN
ncbi:acyltransferase [Litoribacillus peritrichatus]|uniref:acyltransferase n=1 Tax=Litoribacillus peritrichatus TaxID=718191 RepID=UPI0031CF897B